MDEALGFARPGDTLVVWRLDRLGRSLKHLIETVAALEEQGISFKRVHENIDTTRRGGKLIFHLFGSLADRSTDLVSWSARLLSDLGRDGRTVMSW